MGLPNDNILRNKRKEQKKFVRMCSERFDSKKLPNNFENWALETQHEHLTNNIEEYFPGIPPSLRYILPALFKDGDCGRSINSKPAWLDMEKFYRGQKFAQNYFSGICIAQMMSLFSLFSIPHGLQALIMSENSNSPYRAFKRYFSTVTRVSNWALEDPWNPKTQAHRDIKEVRKLHMTMRQKLYSFDDEHIETKTHIASSTYSPLQRIIADDSKESCPMLMMSEDCPYKLTEVRSINQGDMSSTQWGFAAMMLLYPQRFGAHNVSEEDLDAFCHMWRGLGYLLGIEDEYNFCRGTLQEVRERAEDAHNAWVKPLLQTVPPEWEYMSMCLFKGAGYYLPITSYKVYLLYYCETLGMNMPRLHKSLTLKEKVEYACLNFLLRYLMRLPIVVSLMNHQLHKRVKRVTHLGPKKQFARHITKMNLYKSNSWWKIINKCSILSWFGKS